MVRRLDSVTFVTLCKLCVQATMRMLVPILSKVIQERMKVKVKYEAPEEQVQTNATSSVSLRLTTQRATAHGEPLFSVLSWL